MNETQSIDYPNFGSFDIYTSNQTLKYRASSFLQKEPTTLEWIQSLEKDSVLIDVGANVGIYTIPSALYHVKKVIAIEPEILNYTMLLKNIELNKLTNDQVEALPLAISTEFANQSTKLYLTTENVGDSCHQVGRNQNHLLEKISLGTRKSRSIYCVSLASIVKQATEYHKGPIHIKIDVDGIEEDVCQSLFNEKLINRISSLQIELNSKIQAHDRLIKKLARSGYFYSEEQVNKSRRKSGNFKYFAEIVFRKSIEKDSIKNLPSEFTKTLGNNYEPIKGERKNIPEDINFLSLLSSTVVPLSRQPASYALKNAFEVDLCSNIFHNIAGAVLANETTGFKFLTYEGEASKSHKRRPIKISTIEQESFRYIDELTKQASSQEFVLGLVNIVKHASQYIYPPEYLKEHYASSSNDKLKNTHLICRIRHFLDMQGYSLDFHNDSFDTYCALVAPLIPYSTATSIVNGGFFDRNFKRSPDPVNAVNSDFPNSVFDAKTSPNTYVCYSKEKNLNRFVHKTPLSLHRPNLQPGEIFVIPNTNSYAFGDPDRNQILKVMNHVSANWGHGVLPGVTEPYRPILLIDYVIAKPKSLKESPEFEIMVDLGSAEDLLA